MIRDCLQYCLKCVDYNFIIIRTYKNIKFQILLNSYEELLEYLPFLRCDLRVSDEMIFEGTHFNKHKYFNYTLTTNLMH